MAGPVKQWFINNDNINIDWLTVDYLIAYNKVLLTSASTRKASPWLAVTVHSLYAQITSVNPLLSPDAYSVFSDYYEQCLLLLHYSTITFALSIFCSIREFKRSSGENPQYVFGRTSKSLHPQESPVPEFWAIIWDDPNILDHLLIQFSLSAFSWSMFQVHSQHRVA